MQESIGVTRRVWFGQSVSHQDEHFAFTYVQLVSRQVRPARPPILLAGSGGRAPRRVARLADGWLPYPTKAQTYAEEWALIKQIAPRQLARPRTRRSA
ncbi:LLM class flavin-dependent oxidoreductase [Nocardia sp. CA-084685]|uniref:LLM class flavin-dependent oxidoreductase n=1 Tax=Nocardia sp. CA-084685 TaxID=3239970 RepID=UPI003D96F9AE